MRLVTAVIKPHRLDAVKDALRAKGVSGLTVSEVRGFGRQAGHTEVYRGTEYTVTFVPKVKVEVVVDDADATAIAMLIMEAARTDKIGDGKVWVVPVESVFRGADGRSGPRRPLGPGPGGTGRVPSRA
jgi:nitrogen regulatory protein P-II 1